MRKQSKFVTKFWKICFLSFSLCSRSACSGVRGALGWFATFVIINLLQFFILIYRSKKKTLFFVTYMVFEIVTHPPAIPFCLEIFFFVEKLSRKKCLTVGNNGFCWVPPPVPPVENKEVATKKKYRKLDVILK